METPKAIKIDNTHFILQEDYTYTWTINGENASDSLEEYKVETSIRIEKGFRWDGASIPKMFWSWGFKTDGKYRAAALVHDFIYIYEGKLPTGSIVSKYVSASTTTQEQIQYGSFSRADADRLFGKMMRENDVSPFRRTIMKRIVIWFGWMYWLDGPDLKKKATTSGIVFVSVIVILLKALCVF